MTALTSNPATKWWTPIHKGMMVALLCAFLSALMVGFNPAWGGTGVPECFYPEGDWLAGGSGQVSNPRSGGFPQATEVGSTQLFWAYAQGFFAGYYRLSATCQDTSAHAYYFTEDAYINDLCASPVGGDTVLAAANGGLYRSTDGGLSWNVFIAGLPTATGNVGVLDSSDYNHRCVLHCLFSRAEYGGASFDTVWVGTEYGPFWRSPALGDSFELRASLMATNPDGFKPETFEILGHPVQTQVLWAATEDGVYMTRNARNWKHVAGGLPPSEGTIWDNAPAYALAYDQDNNLLYTATSKGVFYGTPRPLATSATAEIIVSWKPLGGEVAITADSTHPATVDTLWLSVPEASSLGLSITAGQSITVMDTTTDIYWAAFVDASVSGLYALLTDDRIFYYPTGTNPPSVNYGQLDLNNLVAYAYSQISGNALHVEIQDTVTTIWLGTSAGLVAYQFTGDIVERYSSDQETISSLQDSLAIYKIAQQGEEYYVATDQGLFKASDLGGAWQRLSGYVFNANHSDSVVVDTRTVAFGPGDVVFTGGYLGGFLHSEDGSTFDFSNLGMMHRNGTLPQIGLFANEFENSTPSNPDKGIFETVQDWWGQLPAATSAQDIDGDPRVAVLFLDIDDQYYLATGDGTYINGYYDGENEYSLLVFINSNQREMFYLDSDPQWINRAGPAACNQMFNLINYNQDSQEAIWLREGMASFSQWAAGYPLATGTLTFPSLNSLTAWGDKNRDEEHLYSFLLVQYLYEQVFPDTVAGDSVIHTIAELATSPYQDVSGLGRLIYEKTVGATSDTVDYSGTFGSLFNDFVIAGSLDVTDTSFYGGKYGFQAVDTRFSTSSSMWYYNPASTPPFGWQIPFWSGRIYQVQDDWQFFNAEHPITVLKVNGDDRNLVHFDLLFSFCNRFTSGLPADSVALIEIPTDWAKQKGEINLADPLLLDSLGVSNLVLNGPSEQPNLMRLLAVCTSDSGEAYSYYVMSDDTLPPPFLYQTIAQNPIDDHYLDVYSFTSEHIYPDGGQLYRVEAVGLTELEGPKVDISGGVASGSGNDTLITLDQNIFFANEGASAFIYHIAYHLETIDFPAHLDFLTYGEDAAGNEKASDTLGVMVDFIHSQSGGYLCDEISGASASIPPGALPRDAYVMLSVSGVPVSLAPEIAYRGVASPLDASHYPVGSLVSAGCAGLDLNAPIEVEIPYDPALAAGNEVGVYRAEGNGWIYVGGVANPQTGLIKSYSWKFGQFQAMGGPLGDILPEAPYTFKLEQNYPNPFNPTTRIQFELGYSQRVRLAIYNVQGRQVAQLADGILSAGRHERTWTPQRLSSGVYFLRLQAAEGTLYRKILFLK